MSDLAEFSPCGTPAAARRHWRRGEPLDAACANAANAQTRDRLAQRQEAAAQAGIEVTVVGGVVTLTAPLHDMQAIAAAVLDRALLHEREARQQPSQSSAAAAARRFRAIHKRLVVAMRRAGVAA